MSQDNGKQTTVPMDQEAERALIGSIFINPASLQMVDIEAAEFYTHKHKWIWEALCALSAEGKSIDPITITNRLKRQKKLDQVGGQAELISILNSVPSSLNFESYASIVRDTSNRRILLTLANKIAKEAYDTKSDIDLSHIAQQLVQSVRHENSAKKLSGYANDFYEDIVQLMANPDNNKFGISTGYLDFDNITNGGVFKKQGLLVAAAPKVGKSMFCMQMGEQIARNHDLPGVIYSMEMNNRYYLARRLSATGQIGFNKIMAGDLNTDEFENFESALVAMRDLPIWFSDASSWSINALRSDLTRLKIEHNIQWAVIDYLGMLRDFGYKSSWEENDYKSKGVIQIFKDLNLAGVVIHTIIKAGQRSTVPTTADLNGSQVGYDFDTILFMAEDEKQENIVHFYPGDARHASSNGEFQMVRNPHYPMFNDAIIYDQIEIPDLDYEPQLPYKDD